MTGFVPPSYPYDRLNELRAANPSVEPRYLRIGATLTVPLAPSTRRGLR